MLHVLFILLKILGILLLLLIGLILLVLLTPIRYSFGLEKEEQASPEFTIRITWLVRIFYFKASYIEKVFDYRIRVLGHQIAGNQKEFLEKQKEKADRKNQKEKKREERRKQKENRDKKSHKKKEVSETPSVTATEKELPVKKAQEDILGEEKSHECQEETKVQKQENRQENKKKKDSILTVLKNIKNKINSIKETKSTIDKLPWREWLELGKDIFIRFLKHVLPRKLEGTVEFGLGDPADTGYVTAIAAIFYSRYGEHFSMYPDFERKMFAAHCKGKGRIRPGYMLVLVVSILKEKSVRTMIKNIILG